jgi:hypothetical protein
MPETTRQSLLHGEERPALCFRSCKYGEWNERIAVIVVALHLTLHEALVDAGIA